MAVDAAATMAVDTMLVSQESVVEVESAFLSVVMILAAAKRCAASPIWRPSGQ